MNNMPSQNDDRDSSVGEYLSRAAAAVAQGNQMLALHLYLAAFERGQVADDSVPTEAAIDGLKRAWRLACSLKERSIAEYVSSAWSRTCRRTRWRLCRAAAGVGAFEA